VIAGVELGAFLLAVGLIELTPGPNMAYLTLVAARDGWRSGLVTVAGVTLAFAIYLAATAVGLLELLTLFPWAFQGLRWAGVAFLVWLAVETWRGPAGADPALGVAPRRGLFWRGLATNLLNPKAAVFYVLLLPGFIPASALSPVAWIIGLGGLHIAVSVVVHVAIVWLGARASPALSSLGGRLTSGLFTAGLVAVAGWLAFGDLAAR
jgi:threonine/homoserine/homoserine lactone efflux protein